MGWRFILINQATRINYRLNNIGILNNDEQFWINLDEIDTILIEDLRCNTSIKLLTELSKKGISVILCGQNHEPVSSIVPFQNNKRSAKYNNFQIQWTKEIKQEIWKQIVQRKIFLQLCTLKSIKQTDKINLLAKYIEEVEAGDLTNREGLAAKIYFRELFGSEFIRTKDASDIINSALNFMYQIIRSKITQEIVGHGYIPSLGIYHCSEYNYYSLADDLIEVFRPICDFYLIKLLEELKPDYMDSFLKQQIIAILFCSVLINNSNQKIVEAIKIYTMSVLDALTNSNLELLKFPELIQNE